MFPLSVENQKIARNIVEKLKAEREKRGDKLSVITFKYLQDILDKNEKNFVQKLIDVKPKDYGKLEPFLGILPVPKNLKKIKGQEYIWKNEKKEIAIQYLPRNVYKAYKKLNKAVKKDLGRQLLIKSGYRSPAYQVLTFLYYLVEEHKFNHARTMPFVAIPGYSEHGYPRLQAIDFITQDGIIQGREASFENTKEYEWLLKNAQKFHFYLSYPKNNKYNVAFEPWHWHYENPKT